MNRVRRARLSSAIMRELSTLITTLGDPRIEPVVINGLELSEDGKSAMVKISLIDRLSGLRTGDSSSTEALPSGDGTVAALNSASGFLRSQISETISVRRLPELFFKEDKGLENSIRVEELIKINQRDRDDDIASN